jgi:exopolysaccharide biosynthesis polyprenyl glycosylphosphotransferase
VFESVNRVFDIVVGLIGILISIPVILVFGLLIKMEDGGPVFYTQERVGRYGKHFTLYKLRSMKVNAEDNGAQWADVDDPRITRIGRFIRRTRIDEWPQFLNVILGDMSMVGPRPERPEFVVEFDQKIPGFIERLSVKPGLTGWAQVNGGYDISAQEKLELDLWYIQNRSFYLNLSILCKTFKVLLTGVGAR